MPIVVINGMSSRHDNASANLKSRGTPVFGLIRVLHGQRDLLRPLLFTVGLDVRLGRPWKTFQLTPEVYEIFFSLNTLSLTLDSAFICFRFFQRYISFIDSELIEQVRINLVRISTRKREQVLDALDLFPALAYREKSLTKLYQWLQ
jgi:hypothetical protein